MSDRFPPGYKMVDELEELEDLVHVTVGDLPNRGYGVMEEIRRQGKLCDVTLKVGEHKFSAHRIVLAASIPYFHAMFTNDMMECKQDEIVMQGMDPCALEALINFAYNGHLAIDQQNVQSLLMGASFLQLQNIKDACCSFLKERDLVDEAKDYHLMPERRPHLLAFKTRPRCCTSIAGLIYAVGGLNSAAHFYAGDSLNVVEVFDPIANRWEKCQPMTTARSRVGVAVVNGLLYAIGGYDGQSRLSTVEVYNPETDSWTKVGSMNSKRSAMGTVVLDGQIYVCGGYDGNCSLNSVETYSPETDKWTVVTPMSSNRSAAGVTVFEGRIYVSGGHDGLQIFNTMEYYNHHTATWHPVASMLNKRCRHGAASLGSKMFICGGYDGSAFLSVAEVYNSMADQWYLITPMNTRRSRVSLVANCGRLYAVGGYDGQSNLNSVEMYDPETNRWTFMAPMVCHEGGVGVGCIPLLTI
ncbi:hypothetical protein GDO78_013959 [Eleutherodactylus coqui]|uniref:BTB domain-containing protein n=2 Tax=Eleutherodactylus coqui TaxID=57060 RepID=A0A8J6JQN0_ELECQ|nr:hypothetical protein GDO78_013959 [Eleutherodactylus coqui]